MWIRTQITEQKLIQDHNPNQIKSQYQQQSGAQILSQNQNQIPIQYQSPVENQNQFLRQSINQIQESNIINLILA